MEACTVPRTFVKFRKAIKLVREVNGSDVPFI